jgi:hypothetical protein
MTDLKKAAQQALELRRLADKFSEGWHDGIKIDATDVMLLAEVAAALEQPEQEPEVPPELEAHFRHLDSQMEQELVAWVEKDGELVWCDKARATGRNLYIHPPRRETEPAAFDALVAISLLTHLGGEVADYADVVDAVRRLHTLNGELLEALKECLNCEFAVTDKAAISKARAAIAKAEGQA